jgi:hypothetical protein
MEALQTVLKGIAIAGIITAAFLPGRQTVAGIKAAGSALSSAEGTAIKG